MFCIISTFYSITKTQDKNVEFFHEKIPQSKKTTSRLIALNQNIHFPNMKRSYRWEKINTNYA